MAMAGGVVADCATSGDGSVKTKTPFDVAASVIPIVGMAPVFPLRRVYCVGRSCAAPAHVFGCAIGLDMTRRDLQRAMGDQQKPGEIGKSVDRSAPIGPIHPVAGIGHFAKGAISLKVNGQIKQNADLRRMIWPVAEQIPQLSQAHAIFKPSIIYSRSSPPCSAAQCGAVLVWRPPCTTPGFAHAGDKGRFLEATGVEF